MDGGRQREVEAQQVSVEDGQKDSEQERETHRRGEL